MTGLERLYNFLHDVEQLGLKEIKLNILLDMIKYRIKKEKDERPNNRKSNKSN